MMYSTPTCGRTDDLLAPHAALNTTARSDIASTPSPLTVFPVEEPAFTGNRGFLATPSSTRSTTLHIHIPSESPMPPRIPATVLRRNEFLPEPLPQARRALPRALSVLVVAGLMALGYLASTRSLSAFQSAWRLTDTLHPKSSTTVGSRYAFENAEIPGPFESGGSLWDALRKHLHLPSPTVPRRNF